MSQPDPKTTMSTGRDHRRLVYEQLVGTPIANGRFRLTRLLGFGGMGAVYEAVQLNMNRPVALKLIPTHDPTAVARFEREALTISQLRHPNTITVFDYGHAENGFLYLSMELLKGQTLGDLVKAVGPIHPRRAVHIAAQICRSLNEAHHAGIVHRDIKPDNIILITVDQDDSVVKVLDFGIAKAVMGDDDVQLTGDGRIIGTPRYMSPEQILADPLDHRSDIYSLGCIIFEMLTGAPPFQQSSTTALMISHTQDPPPAFAQRLSGPNLDKIPPYLEAVVRKALAKDPNDRQQTTEELRRELEDAMAAIVVGQSMQFMNRNPTMQPAPLASQSGMLLSSATQSGQFGPALQTGNFGQPQMAPGPPTGNFNQHPVTGSFNPPIATSNQPAPQMPEAPAKSSLVPMVAVGLVLAVLVAVGIQVLSSPTPAPDAVGSRSQKTGSPVSEPALPEPTRPKLVSVEVTTEPPGARILKDGLDTKKLTPTLIALESGAAVSMTFEKDGYLPYQAEVVPEPGAKLSVKLVARSSSRPRDAEKSPRPVVVKPKPDAPAETDAKKTEPVNEPTATPVKTPSVDMLDDDEDIPQVPRLN